MTLASTTEVRSLMGNKTIYDHNNSDITSTVLTDAITRSDARVALLTGSEWTDTTDPVYYSAVQASEYFAASYILTRYGKNENEINKEAKDYYDMAIDICETLASSSTAAMYTSSVAYRSYPLNSTSGTIHRSLGGPSAVDPMKCCY